MEDSDLVAFLTILSKFCVYCCAFAEGPLTQLLPRNGQLPYVAVIRGEERAVLCQLRMGAFEEDECKLVQTRSQVIPVGRVVQQGSIGPHRLDVVETAYA